MSEEIKSPLKAIKAYCLNCGDGTYNTARDCVIKKCPLYPFRLGHNPFAPKREVSKEERALMSERMRKINEAQRAKKENKNNG